MKQRVRAVIVDNDAILLIHRKKDDQEYWVFPGGAVEPTDPDLVRALQREVLEELGLEINVGQIFASHCFDSGGEKREEFFYSCKIVGGKLGTGKGPEFQSGSSYQGTYQFEWIPLTKLSAFNVLPIKVKEKILQEVKYPFFR